MPEATPPAPANGAQPGTPQTPAAPVEAPEVSAAKAELARVEAARREVEKKEREHVLKTRKLSEEKKTWGEKLSKLAEYEKREKFAKTNPAGYLQSIYGDKWHDVVTEARINGVAPADLVAEAIENVRSEVEQKFAEKEKAAAAEREAQHQAAIQQTRRTLAANAHAFVTANAKDYPIFEGEPPEKIAALLAQRIETEYNSQWSKNQATGATTIPLSIKQAADLVEQEMLAIAEKAAAHEKYRPKLTERMKPPVPAAPVGAKSQQVPTQQRRTLSNDVTGSTPGRAAPVSEEDRRQRAIAAFNAARNKATT